jgi:hypothetical protein
VPAVRTVVLLIGTVVISVILSVIATITLIAVMNAGVILPGYTRFNQQAPAPTTHASQPAQLSQLGICVGKKKGQIWAPLHAGSCASGAKFVRIQPLTSHSQPSASHSPSPAHTP